MAALLWEAEGWAPRCSASGKPTLNLEDNARLSSWQREHLRLSWIIESAPHENECDVVRILEPPMNRECNRNHPFYPTMGGARDRLRTVARSAGRAP